MKTSPLVLHAAPASGFDDPYEMLRACHERVARMLRLLQRLGAHLDTAGADAEASQAARDVMRYFDTAAPHHHQDEERHVFPALLAAGDPALHGVVQRLLDQHREMERLWPQVRADLQRVVDRAAGADDVAAAAGAPRLPLRPTFSADRQDRSRADRWAAFDALYRQHIELEEGRAYPAAEATLEAAQAAAMGAEMAARRGVPAPPGPA